MDDKLAQCLITLAERTMVHWRYADMRGEPVIKIPNVIYDRACESVRSYLSVTLQNASLSSELPVPGVDFSIVGVKFKRQQESAP